MRVALTPNPMTSGPGIALDVWEMKSQEVTKRESPLDLLSPCDPDAQTRAWATPLTPLISSLLFNSSSGLLIDKTFD